MPTSQPDAAPAPSPPPPSRGGPPPGRAGLSVVQRRMIQLAGLGSLALAAAGGVVWQVRHDAGREEAKARDERPFSWAEAGKIQGIELSNRHGQFTLARSDAAGLPWRMSAPRALGADGAVVDSLLAAALDGRLTVLPAAGRPAGGQGGGDDSPGAIDWQLFGLASPRLTLTLVGPDSQRETLSVGASQGFNDTLFVRRGARNEVATTASALLASLERDQFDLRDKRVLHLPSSHYDEVRVQPAGGRPFQLGRSGGELALAAPIQAPADPAQADALVQALAGLRANAFAAEEAASDEARRPYGLDRPLFVVDITDDTSARCQLRLGRVGKGGQDKIYAQADGHGPVAEVAGDWAVKKLSVGLWELRDKHLARTRPDTVQRLVLTENGHELVLTRGGRGGQGDDGGGGSDGGDEGDGATPGGRGWHMAVGDASEPADSDRVGRALTQLCDLEATGVVSELATEGGLAAAGIQAPALEVRMEGDGAALLAHLKISGESGGERQVGQQAGRPLWRIDAHALAGLGANPADFRRPEPPPVQASAPEPPAP